MRSLSSKLALAGAAGVLAVLAARAWSDGYGGSLEPITPYAAAEIVTPASVAAHRAEAKRHMPAACSGFEAPTGNLGLAYIRTNGQRGPTMYTWSGSVDGKRHDVGQSDIASIRIIRQDPSRRRTLVSLLLFPTLTPTALVKLQPSYRMLDPRFRKTVAMWVLTTDAKRGDLHIVGDAPDEGMPPHAVALARIPADSEIRFRGPTSANPRDPKDLSFYWWAIPSVARDRAYPYHEGPMAS
ncbi:MAG TPA: hypothetical protein VGM37_02655 [Armatimonadota bacterium]|jgi:hypothetical protein